jgi:hypothetical protein
LRALVPDQVERGRLERDRRLLCPRARTQQIRLADLLMCECWLLGCGRETERGCKLFY